MKVHGVFHPAFGSRILSEWALVSLTPYEKNYIDDFEEGKVSDIKYLGEGVTSKAYYSPICNFVIKHNKFNPYVEDKASWSHGSLAHEYKILTQISPKVKSTQRGIAYLETEKGGKFLLSTLVAGTPADINSNPFTSKYIDRLLRNLYRLDKSGIIHSDLSRPNLLLDNENNVNIIDYQWADKYDLNQTSYNFNLRNAAFAPIEAPNNANMFESAALAGYSRKIPKNDLQVFLKNYYSNKAHYVEKNIKRLNSFIQSEDCYSNSVNNLVDFEQAKLKAYSNIDPYIVEAEVLKMNILNLHRRQYSCYDINKIEERNILRAIPLTLKAKECAEKLYNYTKGYEVDRAYYAGMKKIAEFWQKNMWHWYIPALMNVFDILSGEKQDPAKIYFPEKLFNFDKLDVVELGESRNLVKYKYEDNLLRQLFLLAKKKGFKAVSKEREKVYDILWRIFSQIR